MPKKLQNFRLEEERIKELERLAKFYSTAQELDGFLPGKKFTKTDIIEFLIAEKFKELHDEGGFEV